MSHVDGKSLPAAKFTVNGAGHTVFAPYKFHCLHRSGRGSYNRDFGGGPCALPLGGWVGAGSTILDGTVLGDNTIIVANSLVNRRFPPNVVIQGNPGKVILRRSKGKEEK